MRAYHTLLNQGFYTANPHHCFFEIIFDNVNPRRRSPAYLMELITPAISIVPSAIDNDNTARFCPVTYTWQFSNFAITWVASVVFTATIPDSDKLFQPTIFKSWRVPLFIINVYVYTLIFVNSVHNLSVFKQIFKDLDNNFVNKPCGYVDKNQTMYIGFVLNWKYHNMMWYRYISQCGKTSENPRMIFQHYAQGRNMENTNFSKVLRDLMNGQNMTQVQLSQLLDMRQSQVSNWLNGKSLPGYHSIRVLCKKFGISADELLQMNIDSE